MSDLDGAVVWAVVPYAPQAPFRLYAGAERAPITVDEPGKLFAAAKKGGDPELTYLVPGKVRPVLIISTHSQFNEVLALRLTRFSKLSTAEQQTIRAQEDPGLFHLRPESFPKLAEESAAMIGGLARLDASAIESSRLGRLNPAELATVHERLVRFHGFNLDMLVMQKIQQLGERQKAQRQQR